jgi:elongation factor P
MVACSQLSPGMVIKIGRELMRVESAVKVSAGAAQPYMKVKLLSIPGEDMSERKLKLDQEIEEVLLKDVTLEYLYLQGSKYLFLDIDTLEQIEVETEVVAERKQYLKEGVQVKAHAWGNSIFAVELPQFLEIMVARIQEPNAKYKLKGNSTDHLAVLETGAVIEVPPFIESGDVIKVDTRSDEFIQRV